MPESKLESRKRKWRTDLGQIERRLGYRFKNRNLLELALTHHSADRRANYELLEFLGDRSLHYVVPKLLLESSQNAEIAEINRMYSNITRNRNLAFMALRLHLSPFIRLRSHEKSIEEKVLADVVEGVIGAIDEDGGIEAVATVCKKIFAIDILVAKVDYPQEQLLSLVEQRKLGRLHYHTIPVRCGNHKHSPRWDIVVAKLQEPRSSRQITIGTGRGFGLEQATNNAAVFALFALNPSPYGAESFLPLKWEINC